MSDDNSDNAVENAAMSGDKLKLLIALRNRLAAEIGTAPARDLSPLTRRLQDVVNEIEELEAIEKAKGGGGSGSTGQREGRQSTWSPDDL